MKKNFKKGDWVVNTEFNQYPFKLSKDPAKGWFHESLTGNSFYDSVSVHGSSKDFDEVMGQAVLAVNDPRMGTYPGDRLAWVPATSIRAASKRDFNKLLKIAKKMASNASKELHRVRTAMKESGL